VVDTIAHLRTNFRPFDATWYSIVARRTSHTTGYTQRPNEIPRLVGPLLERNHQRPSVTVIDRDRLQIHHFPTANLHARAAVHEIDFQNFNKSMDSTHLQSRTAAKLSQRSESKKKPLCQQLSPRRVCTVCPIHGRGLRTDQHSAPPVQQERL
jgi:hypothetical protein